VAGGVDTGVLEETGFGAGHALDGAAKHSLDGGVGEAGVEGLLDGVDVGDVGFVGDHPAADAGVELVEVFDDESAAGVVAVGSDPVEGEDEGVAELVDVAAEPEGGGEREVGASDELGGDGVRAEGAQGSGDGAVGADQGAGVAEAERAQDVHGVGVAAARSDDNLDAGGFGGQEGGEVARADAAVVAEQGSVHVQRNETWGDQTRGEVAVGNAWLFLRQTLPPLKSQSTTSKRLRS